MLLVYANYDEVEASMSAKSPFGDDKYDKGVNKMSCYDIVQEAAMDLELDLILPDEVKWEVVEQLKKFQKTRPTMGQQFDFAYELLALQGDLFDI